MSSTAKKMEKNLRNNILRFAPSMYNNCYGSVVLVYCMSTGIKSDMVQHVNTLWKKIEANPDEYFDFVLDQVSDAEFIERTLKVFGYEPTSTLKSIIVRVTSPYNSLFTAQVVPGKLLPLREDGFKGITLKTGKVTKPYPATES